MQIEYFNIGKYQHCVVRNTLFNADKYLPLFANPAVEEDTLVAPSSLMKSSTPSWMGLGSTDLPEQLSETAVIIALVIYTIMAVAVYILIFIKLYFFF